MQRQEIFKCTDIMEIFCTIETYTLTVITQTSSIQKKQRKFWEFKPSDFCSSLEDWFAVYAIYTVKSSTLTTQDHRHTMHPVTLNNALDYLTAIELLGCYWVRVTLGFMDRVSDRLQ